MSPASLRAIAALARDLAALTTAAAEESDAGADEWLDLDAAAEVAHVAPRVIRDDARRGRLTLGGAGRTRLVARAELDRWIASRTTTAPTPLGASVRDAARDAVAAAARRAGGTR